MRPGSRSGRIRSPPFARLVSSSDGLRLARHARRKGGAFPVFSDDDVVQLCVEEALAVRLDRFEDAQAAEAARDDAVTSAERRVHEQLEQLRKADS